MRLQLIQSIPLDTRSKEYWREAGGVFMRRDRTEPELKDIARDYEATLNLGNSSIVGADWPCPIYNPAPEIAKILTPGATRRSMPELLPPAPREFPADGWLKRPGRGGLGKERAEINEGMMQALPRDWDIQMHIEGLEYRVITVGRRVVQVTQRNNPGMRPRSYTWVGLSNTPPEVKNIARAGAMKLDNALVGWDVVFDPQSENAYILEGNSCPGVNNPTVGRIMTELDRQVVQGDR